ncbi:MAG: alpha-galactosidase [Flavobacterium sp.]|nr:alpha-galactosidase [Flavobacterium sp.]
MKNKLIILFIFLSQLSSAQSFQAGKNNLSIEGNDKNFDRAVKVRSLAPGIEELEITLSAQKKSIPSPIIIKFKQASIDIQSYLAPYGADALSQPTSLYQYPISRMIPVSFNAKPAFTSAMMSQPSMTLINNNNTNRLTVAVSELTYPTTFQIGENEDKGVGFDIKIGLFGYPTKAVENYKVKIRLDSRDINYNLAQQDLLDWWKTENHLNFASVPEKAYSPFYCTWYALKADGVNDKNVEQQAQLAQKIGCETIIVDDGWQKAYDAKSGYCAYNGDWEIDPTRFKDFKQHVKKVHELGLSYMLWTGPSMIGEKSKIFETLKDKMLYKADWANAWVVDPRFPEVRKHLTDRLISIMKENDIDGFKIDFMDLINSRYAPKNLPMGNGRDYESVEEATVKLLSDIYSGCKAINPKALIEYRVFFTNPILQQYANMFRAIDCPNNILENRTRTLDARNLNKQVIHADPLAWNENETPEVAALQLLQTMLSVPQISTDLTKTSESHLKMLQFLLKQWKEFNEVLTRGQAYNYGPEANYTWSEVSLDKKTVIVAYQPTVLTPTLMNKDCLIINATHQNSLIFDCKKDLGTFNISVYDCSGKLIRKDKVKFNGLVKIDLPTAGIIRTN